MNVGEFVLLPTVSGLGKNANIAASGTSCGHQIHDGTERAALHPAEILRAALRRQHSETLLLISSSAPMESQPDRVSHSDRRGQIV
jgi:hypothetical protein